MIAVTVRRVEGANLEGANLEGATWPSSIARVVTSAQGAEVAL